ncbi:hypothetical protein A3H85_02455 [Candidatus Daviesbacteria bacterium RIFCSPLOWO2_02_FULL_40_8]|uniref:DUF6199 domain-containing protein n=1 Tax=Candidatus Daviesbacteria bacterium RIFCSPLOWO2_01_FULL_40_24 TaxID=1797787 RepID=A0A1F5MIG1_9BACT|nr:MAG: hypothetical protein A2780_01185 [Candidatus Daviesbacteria bacterium RIFCSPHIGHO2_01_FULL_41_45]OGE33965.1 MAG: hypothetical protein A3C32_01155 [Candidatus Daviesbacteria bacterium RIFCSPHIGHO2_02_FULL_41_14]OGE65138.1 MAG: hypothetical protein A3B49_03150 [Candidatus Daviesbacteria bacterium RIFCSPLOWO2_01_FULL_40_24]OGE67008.1 MAG: hypothetical protein A3H85_02455 [Candidatus Daviesbacteria bacterium RIFCSPLOWO2_02_FULL_40_8]
MNVVLTFFGIVFVLGGFMMFFRPTMEFMIRLTNSMKGIHTKITSVTVWTYRISGVLAVLFGLFLLMGSGVIGT